MSRRQLINSIAAYHQTALAACKRPIPLRYWTGLRSAVRLKRSAPDFLSDLLYSRPPHTGGGLSITPLRQILSNQELGYWAIDADSIEHVWTLFQQDRPTQILECGAGISTLMFAEYFAEWHKEWERGAGSKTLAFAKSYPRQYTHVLSLEQNLDYVKKISALLKELGLSDYATVLHAPLSSDGAYLIPNELGKALNGQLADWIFIDGPFGPPGCRQYTLPALKAFCRPRARWIMDDGFRDGELEFLRQWKKNFVVTGIWPIGKGLATGFVDDKIRDGNGFYQEAMNV